MSSFPYQYNLVFFFLFFIFYFFCFAYNMSSSQGVYLSVWERIPGIFHKLWISSFYKIDWVACTCNWILDICDHACHPVYFMFAISLLISVGIIRSSIHVHVYLESCRVGSTHQMKQVFTNTLVRNGVTSSITNKMVLAFGEKMVVPGCRLAKITLNHHTNICK